MTQFRLQPCQRCQRDTIQALRDDPSTPLRTSHRICSACEPAAFERVAVEAGRRELLG